MTWDLKAKFDFVGGLGLNVTFDLFPHRDDFFAAQTYAQLAGRRAAVPTAEVLHAALRDAGFAFQEGAGYRSSTGESRVYKHADGRELLVSVPKGRTHTHVCVS